MKFIRQLTILLAFCFVSEILHEVIPLPVPGSIYGMVLLFVALQSGLLKLSSISETAHFFVEIMTIMFIPSAASLVICWDILKPVFLPYTIITVISTFLAFGVTGRVTQAIMRAGKEKK